MADITFLASFGDHDKTVVLSKLMGGYYHVYVDGFYWGQVHLRNGKWVVLLQDPDLMDSGDMDAISDRIEEHENNNR
jgi:hypothetical protein